MNLSSKDWKHNQSEITAESVGIGDQVRYSDVCNCLVYQVIEKDDDTITIQSVDDPKWVEVKRFEQLNSRWEFHGEKNFEQLTTRRKFHCN